MAQKHTDTRETAWTSKSMLKDAIIGGIMGALAGFMSQAGLLTFPWISRIVADNPIIAALTGVLLGASASMVRISLKQLLIPQYKAIENTAYADSTTLQLHEEQLELIKNWVQTNDVNIRKEVITEKKNIVVPIIREELVIEKKSITPENSGTVKSVSDMLRIPISEEHIEVIKHPVRLEDVSIYKRRFQELRHIEETLKKEKINVKTTGESGIIDNKTDKQQ